MLRRGKVQEKVQQVLDCLVRMCAVGLVFMSSPMLHLCCTDNGAISGPGGSLGALVWKFVLSF